VNTLLFPYAKSLSRNMVIVAVVLLTCCCLFCLPSLSKRLLFHCPIFGPSFGLPKEHAHRYCLTMVLVSSASLTTIPPFFEPGAPPPTLPILLAQTEVGATDIPVKLLAQEEIGSGPTVARSSRSMLRYHPYPKSTRKQHPSLKPQANPTHDDDAPSGIAVNETDSELTSVTDSEIESESDTPLIPKPDGEAGRPNRGGYNLEKALEWEHKKYIRVKVRGLFC